MIPELLNLANQGQGKPGDLSLSNRSVFLRASEAAIGGPLVTDQFAIEVGP